MLDRILAFAKDSTPMVAFLSIFGVGLVVTLFSLVFGGHHDSDFHADAGHDSGPGMLSIRGLSLMATGFGAVSFLVMYYTRNVLLASVSGVAFGWVFGLAGIGLMRLLMRQEGSSMIQSQELIGAIGEITTGIPARGVGEVRLDVAGVAMSKTASSADGSSIPSGTSVRVVRAVGGKVAVEIVGAKTAGG